VQLVQLEAGEILFAKEMWRCPLRGGLRRNCGAGAAGGGGLQEAISSARSHCWPISRATPPPRDGAQPGVGARSRAGARPHSGSPEFLKVLLRFLRDRLIATLAHTSPLFAPFSEMERVALTSKFRFLRWTVICAWSNRQEGHRAFHPFGRKAAAVADGAPVAHLQAGDVFGDISLIADSPATATVVTLEKSFVLQLPRSDFNEVIMTHPRSWNTSPHWLTIAYKHRVWALTGDRRSPYHVAHCASGRGDLRSTALN